MVCVSAKIKAEVAELLNVKTVGDVCLRFKRQLAHFPGYLCLPVYLQGTLRTLKLKDVGSATTVANAVSFAELILTLVLHSMASRHDNG